MPPALPSDLPSHPPPLRPISGKAYQGSSSPEGFCLGSDRPPTLGCRLETRSPASSPQVPLLKEDTLVPLLWHPVAPMAIITGRTALYLLCPSCWWDFELWEEGDHICLSHTWSPAPGSAG